MAKSRMIASFNHTENGIVQEQRSLDKGKYIGSFFLFW